jgi:hypothetical protein
MITTRIDTVFTFVIPAKAGIQFFSFFSVSSAKRSEAPAPYFPFCGKCCGGVKKIPC